MHRVLIALVLAAVASPAGAQPAPWSPERTTAGWVFVPSFVFGGLWDSNVTVRNEDNPQTSELVGTISPRGEIGFNGRRARFHAGYSGVLETYRTLGELTRYDQRGRVEARYQMTPRLMFQSRTELSLTPTTDQLELGGLLFTRVGSRQFGSRNGFTLQLSNRATLTSDLVFEWVNFERRSDFANEFTLLKGGHAVMPTAELSYALTRRVSVGGTYSFRHMNINASEQLFDTQHVMGTVNVVVGPSTTVRGMGGLAYMERTRAAQVEPITETGPSFGGGISHRVVHTIFDAGFERNFMPSFGFGGLSANQVYYVRASMPMAQGRLYWSGGITFRKTEPIVRNAVDAITLDSRWTTATVGYFVARWLRMEGFYALTHQTSSARGNVGRTRVGVQFVTSKPVRLQ